MNDAVPATFEDGSTTKEVLGVGIYTVAADGTVTFTPDPRFVGEAPAVTVVREDMNGTKASATYTPTVTPITPTAKPATSEAPQGIVQTGKPTFTEGDPIAPMNPSTLKLYPDSGDFVACHDAASLHAWGSGRRRHRHIGSGRCGEEAHRTHMARESFKIGRASCRERVYVLV